MGDEEHSKKEKLTKAERRALQEAQRARKAAERASGAVSGKARLQYDDPKRVAKHAKKQQVQRTKLQKQVPMFSHLPQFERETSLSFHVGFASKDIHPAVLRLGLKLAEGVFRGSTSRCIAMLTAFKEFIGDYCLPEDQVFSRDLQKKLQPQIRFLIDCRPQSISMGNAISYLKMCISKIPNEIDESEGKESVIQSIDAFLQERIFFAHRIIAKNGIARIHENDIILVYSRSHVVEMILDQAFAAGKDFRVIVVDSRPRFEGRAMAMRLVAKGMNVTYALISSVSYVMKGVSKVFLGANSMLSNGAAVGRSGSSIVALHAHHMNIPVIFLSETCKFHHRAQVDAITFNELDDPDDLIRLPGDKQKILNDWRDISSLKILNLMYDLTPSELISLVITEVGEIPSSAVPVIIREYMKDLA